MKLLHGGSVFVSHALGLALTLLGCAVCAPRPATGAPLPPANVPAPTATEQAMIEKTLPAVVRIEAIRLQPNQGRMFKARIGGSGAIISAQGHVLTNYHVADDADYYRCFLTDGTTLEAKCVGLDALTDLAVLQLDLAARPKDAAPLPVASFGDSDHIATGDAVFALGSPASLAQSVTRGVVSNTSLVLPDEIPIFLDGENVGLVVRWILHDASIYPGNSGGPLVDREGGIIGINEIGVANLGGAIPGNLARTISAELIAKGHVTRGWSGLSVQPRLETDTDKNGVVVADVAENSPAAAAGLLPGDVILAGDGQKIGDAEEKAVADFTRLEMNRLPGAAFAVDFLRGSERKSLTLTLVEREPALRRNAEFRTWGAIFRDLTRELARSARLPDTKGVWIENVRPGGPCGQAEPEMNRGDVIVALDGTPVANSAELRKTTEQLLTKNENGHSVLVTLRRGGNLLATVVDLRLSNERRTTPQARRAWIGVAVQPLTQKLATRLGVKAESGVRVTRVHEGTRAAAAGLRVGDVVLKIDDEPVTARRVEDQDAFARQIRQYRADTEVTLTVWREGALTPVKVMLEKQPTPAPELPTYEDDNFELTVRELAFDDRARLQLALDEPGLIVESTIAAGWAALAGLRNDDLLLEAGGTPLATIADFRKARDAAIKGERGWWVLRIKRAGRIHFVEINLKPLKT